MSFTIHDIAADLASRSSHLADYGREELKDKYVKRLRHTCAEGLHRITREGDGARAPQLFNKEEACLAALSLLCTEVLDFDVHMQRAILDGARHSLNGQSLSGAVAGIAKGEHAQSFARTTG